MEIYFAEEGRIGRCLNDENNEDCKWRTPADGEDPNGDSKIFMGGGHDQCFLKLKIVERDSPETVEMQNRIKKIDPEAQWFGRKV